MPKHDEDIDLKLLKETIHKMVLMYSTRKMNQRQQDNLSRDILTLCRRVVLGNFDKEKASKK